MRSFLRSGILFLVLQSTNASTSYLRHLQKTSNGDSLSNNNNSSQNQNNNQNGGLASGIVFFVAITACILWCCGPSMLGCLKHCCVNRTHGRSSRNRLRQTRDQIRQQQLENAIDSMIQSADEADRLRSTVSFLNFMGHSNSEWTSTWEGRRLESRKSYINRTLQTKTYTPGEENKRVVEQKTAVSGEDSEEERICNNQDESNKATTENTTLEQSTQDKMTRHENHAKDDGEKHGEQSLVVTTPPQVDTISEAGSQVEQENVCVICFAEYEAGDEIAWSENDQCQHVFHRDCIFEWLIKKDECPCCRNNFMVFREEDNAAPDFNNPQSFSSRFGSPLYGRSSGVREFLGDDDSHENSLPTQLLRGLEILYRVRALSESSFPPMGGPPVSNNNNALPTSPSGRESPTYDNQQVAVEMVNQSRESVESTSSPLGAINDVSRATNHVTGNGDSRRGPVESANDAAASEELEESESDIIDT